MTTTTTTPATTTTPSTTEKKGDITMTTTTTTPAPVAPAAVSMISAPVKGLNTLVNQFADAADAVENAIDVVCAGMDTLFNADVADAVADAAKTGKCPRRLWTYIDAAAYTALNEYAAAPTSESRALLFAYIAAARAAVGKRVYARDVSAVDMYLIKAGKAGVTVAGKGDFRRFLRGEYVKPSFKVSAAAAAAFDKIAGTNISDAVKKTAPKKTAGAREMTIADVKRFAPFIAGKNATPAAVKATAHELCVRAGLSDSWIDGYKFKSYADAAAPVIVG